MIEFFPQEHEYQVDGIITPSVTTLMSQIWFTDKYKGVNPTVLKNKAEYGNRVHELVENADGELPDWYERKSEEGRALKNYLRIRDRNNIVITSCEVPVAYYDEHGIPVFAGMYDMLGTVDGEISLIDIKTTAKYDAKYLAYQLTMYRMAIQQTDPSIEIKKGYCLHLPKKGYANLIPVNFLDTENISKDIRVWRSNQ